MKNTNELAVFAQIVRDFLVGLANGEIIHGRKYECRIPVVDGGVNSYIGLCVDDESYGHKSPILRGFRIFRHTNSVSHLVYTWQFDLGDVCNAYADYPDTPICFRSCGVSLSDAEKESAEYFDRLLEMIRKQTSDYRIKDAESAQEEREQLLARLSELGES